MKLGQIVVRPVDGAQERRRWKELMARHHYLGFRKLFGDRVRHVAHTPQGRWVALIGWQVASMKIAPRDRWIGWTPEQQYRRLWAVSNNSRFLILPDCSVPNLASRVLSLSTRRLSDDVQRLYGHEVLLAETFVDVSRFRGTCYLAANWQALGRTKGFSRARDGSWSEHGQPKEVLVYPLVKDAPERLRAVGEPSGGRAGKISRAMPPKRLRSLYEMFDGLEEYRDARGKRYSLASFFAIAVAGHLAGCRGPTELAEFAARLSQEHLRAVRAFRSPATGRFTAPSKTTFHRIVSEADPQELERRTRQWVAQHCPAPDAVALDGKTTRTTPRRKSKHTPILVAAVCHGSGVVLGQQLAGPAGQEIQGVRTLLASLDIAGAVVTLDALHAQADTARQIVQQCRAHYLVSVKRNQRIVFDDIEALDWDAPEVLEDEHTTVDKGHGRVETRRHRRIVLDERFDGYVELPCRRQVLRIERTREVLSEGKSNTQISYVVTSLPPPSQHDDMPADTVRLAQLARGHWEIENRLHHVRDVAWNEDRCRSWKGHGARNLACLRNVAISLVRIRGEFACLPQAQRHYHANPHLGMREVLAPT